MVFSALLRLSLLNICLVNCSPLDPRCDEWQNICTEESEEEENTQQIPCEDLRGDNQ